MALVDFVTIPLLNEEDETIKINKSAIIDVRAIEVKQPEIPGSANWYVQVNILPGKYLLVKLEGSPYATKGEALTARDTFLESFD